MSIAEMRRWLVPKSVLSIPELIATIEHSSLPTLLAEGKSDLILLRRLEGDFADFGLSVLPLGGRENVLTIFAQRGTIASTAPLFFLADRDSWVHSVIPTEFLDQSFCFTDGYSIENDLYRDGALERFLLPEERLDFIRELNLFLDWYALALSRHFRDRAVEIAVHPNQVLDDDGHCRSLCALEAAETYPTELRSDLLRDYGRLVRGKSLLSLLLRQLSASGRTPKYSAASLLEIGATAGGRHAVQIKEWLSSQLEG
jgi:hypothetical protein